MFAKHGWQHTIERLQLHHHLQGSVTTLPALADTGLTAIARLRMALEQLGPAFVKFGQMLSVRPDLFPPDVIAELQKLQDSVPPFSTKEARAIIRSELGHQIGRMFSRFDNTPLAAGSIRNSIWLVHSRPTCRAWPATRSVPG